jgi:NAD+ kinase
MKKIGIIPNIDKDLDLFFTKKVIKTIVELGGRALITNDVSKLIGETCAESYDSEGLIKNAELVICLGGDGSFLKVARKVYEQKLPVLGINLGSLGFLAEVDKSEIEAAMARIISGDYEVEERMMLDVSVKKDNKIIYSDVALNDIVISRGALSRIIHLKTYINDEFVDTFPGDGLIISSPTGSTAYSLSSGGPIVEPNIDLLIITPICPHILYSRSFITEGSSTVKILLSDASSSDAMVTADGQIGFPIREDYVIEINKSDNTVKMIQMKRKNFFNILRNKIYFRGENLKKDEI